MKISEILWRAANQRLWNGVIGKDNGIFSTAVLAAWDKDAVDFLGELGGPHDAESDLDAFREFGDLNASQGARYLWLDFARLVAEDDEAAEAAGRALGKFYDAYQR